MRTALEMGWGPPTAQAADPALTFSVAGSLREGAEEQGGGRSERRGRAGATCRLAEGAAAWGRPRDGRLRSTLPCSVGRTRESDARFQPFRMTPYLARVPEPQGTESQLCCVLLAERVHSGYEAPRIPPEKRIFTTTHTPNCLFQDVDER